jgi:hypothetical protein
MIDFDRFWGGRQGLTAPGVSEPQVQAWEARHQVALPASLRSALRRRDGGPVRDVEVEIFPLGEIEPADEEFLRFDEDVDRDPALVFRFGIGRESCGDYLMDYNTGGPEASPSVYIHYNDGTGATLIEHSFDDFFERLAARSPAPDVDWSEAEPSQDVLARETVDLTAFHRAEAHLTQVLVRQGDSLVLYTREVSPQGETLSKTTLPLPIHGALVMVQRMRPAPNLTFGLHLQPEGHEGIVRLESRRKGDAAWVNTKTEGAPIYVRFESADRDRLEALRGRLLGGSGTQSSAVAGPGRAASEDPSIAYLKRAMELKEAAGQRRAPLPGDLSPPPADLGALAALWQQRSTEALERARGPSSVRPPAPGATKRIEDGPPPPDDEHAPG